MRDDSLQATPILARNSGLNEGTHFADFDSRLIFKKNQTQIQIASLVEEIVIYGQLWGSELVDLNFHLEVIQLCWRWTLGKNKWKTTWYRFVWFASANRIIGDEVLNDAYRCL